VSQNSSATGGMDKVFVRQVLPAAGEPASAGPPAEFVLAGHPGGVTVVTSGQLLGRHLIFTGDRVGYLHIWDFQGRNLRNVYLGSRIVQISTDYVDTVIAGTRSGWAALGFGSTSLRRPDADSPIANRTPPRP